MADVEVFEGSGWGIFDSATETRMGDGMRDGCCLFEAHNGDKSDLHPTGDNVDDFHYYVLLALRGNAGSSRVENG